MAKLKVEVAELTSLYSQMTGWFGLGFNQSLAQETATLLAFAGADAANFAALYRKVAPSGGTAEAIRIASASAVNADLNGVIRRYAKDGVALYSHEFQSRYEKQWLMEWLASPEELHVSSDNLAHTAGQFFKQYGTGWEIVWHATLEATQVRLGKDGEAYTMLEFQEFYSDAWQAAWREAPEVPCKQCGPFAMVDVSLPQEIVV